MSWWTYFLCGVNGGLIVYGLWGLVGMARDWLQARLDRRGIALRDAASARCSGKVLRHAPTGDVGLCVGCGYWIEWKWGRPVVRARAMLVTCGSCARRARQFGFTFPSGECVRCVDAADLVAPLAEEAERFARQRNFGVSNAEE